MPLPGFSVRLQQRFPPPLLPSRLVREFIKQFDLKLNPFHQTDDNAWYFVNGIRAKAAEVNRNPDILNYTLRPAERGKSASQLYREALHSVGGHGADPAGVGSPGRASRRSWAPHQTPRWHLRPHRTELHWERLFFLGASSPPSMFVSSARLSRSSRPWIARSIWLNTTPSPPR